MSHPLSDEALSERKPEHPIHKLFLSRWSPRAMTGEQIADSELFSLFEAARWAPSSYNNQPWRILYAKSGSEHWKLFFDLLVEANQVWCQKASALLVIVSKKNFEKNGKPSRTHAFDTGAAWMSLALEGANQELVVHGLQGFDYDRAKKDLNIPDDHEVLAMVAIGKKADKEVLPDPLKKNEHPNARRPLSEIIHQGAY